MKDLLNNTAENPMKEASAKLASASQQNDPKQRGEEGSAPVLAALGLESLPAEPPLNDPTPWLLRRLQVAQHDAGQARQAARGVIARLATDRAPPRDA